MVRIVASAPLLDLVNLKHFGMECIPSGNGRFSASKIFTTGEEARAFLRQQAELYLKDKGKLKKAYEEIQSGYLTMDGITAGIE